MGLTKPEMKLRAVMIWAGDREITIDAYHDDQFGPAVDWLERHGWNIDLAVRRAIDTPLVRVTVDRR